MTPMMSTPNPVNVNTQNAGVSLKNDKVFEIPSHNLSLNEEETASNNILKTQNSQEDALSKELLEKDNLSVTNPDNINMDSATPTKQNTIQSINIYSDHRNSFLPAADYQRTSIFDTLPGITKNNSTSRDTLQVNQKEDSSLKTDEMRFNPNSRSGRKTNDPKPILEMPQKEEEGSMKTSQNNSTTGNNMKNPFLLGKRSDMSESDIKKTESIIEFNELMKQPPSHSSMFNEPHMKKERFKSFGTGIIKESSSNHKSRKSGNLQKIEENILPSNKFSFGVNEATMKGDNFNLVTHLEQKEKRFSEIINIGSKKNNNSNKERQSMMPLSATLKKVKTNTKK
jgi:hypothetical protein